jgi:hypothetical protein
MERYGFAPKRRKTEQEDGHAPAAAGACPSFYTDFWRLVAAHLEWPELYALSKTSRKTRKVAMPLLLQKADPLRQNVIWEWIEYSKRDVNRHYWTLKQFRRKTYVTLTHPRLVNNTTIFGLLRTILQKLDWKRVCKTLGEDFARFCRIVGIYTGPRVKCWFIL